MGALRVTNFGGIIPRLGKRLLPESNAQYALNAKLFSGELRAWWNPSEVANLSQLGYVDFYSFEYEGENRFKGFTEHHDIAIGALINDAFDRVYWTNSTGPYVTTVANIVGDIPLAAVRLGVPAPLFVPVFTVVATGGTPALAETRVYTAILVSIYGEEGSASETVLASGNPDGTWTINGLNAVTYDSGVYSNVSKLRLYRTLTSSTGVDYRQVVEWGIGAVPASYVDAVTATTLSAAPVLQSLAWTPPPTNLKGMIAVAGGFMAGFVGRTIYFSEPYFPHAWPEEYQQAVDADIVALGTYGNVLVVLTAGKPHAAIGTVPAAMSFVKLHTGLPCISKRGVVNTTSAVLYPSKDGLVAVSDAGVSIISRAFVTRDEWNTRFADVDMTAGIFSDRYLSFYADTFGFVIGFDDPSTAFTELQTEHRVMAVRTDEVRGRTLVLMDDAKVYEWDGQTGNAMTFTWRSKQFLTTKPANFGAAQVRGEFLTQGSDAVSSIVIPNGHELNGEVLNTFPINNASSVVAAVDTPNIIGFKLYGDGELRYQKLVESEEPFRLPADHMCVMWEIELSSRIPVFSVSIASTMKALEAVP